MNILILGSGGREHAFAWKIAQSKWCDKLFVAPGNAGTASVATNVNMQVSDFAAIEKFCLENKIEMVLPAGEESLVKGIYDYFLNNESLKHIPVIGPSMTGAQMEGSKAFAKAFMLRHNIPTAAYKEITQQNFEEGKNYLLNSPLPIVLKADGLAAGKGVLICTSHEEAMDELSQMIQSAKFGDASSKVVIEQFLKGIELSVFVLTDGKNYLLLPTAKDYKRIGEGDTGLNTGGMGAISPVPFATKELMQKVEEKIIRPTIEGLQKDKIVYKGFIYFGLINVAGEPFVIEYNCRMGDPETEAVLPRIENDLIDLFKAVADEKLATQTLHESAKAACTVVLASGGYPNEFEKGFEIEFAELKTDTFIFHAGTKFNEQNKIVTAGGRVMMVTALDENLKKALNNAMMAVSGVSFQKKYYRKDIGLDVC